MDALTEVLRANEDDILARVFSAAQRHGYTRYSSTLIEAWRLSVKGLTEALVAGLTQLADLDFGVDDERSDNPVTAFGREEALRHRSRGVTLGMFLGLEKYYRDAFADSVCEGVEDPLEQARRRHVICRLFDRIEIGFCEAWSSADASSGSAELEKANRALANEKNRYLTVLESIAEAVFVVDPKGAVVYANLPALTLAGNRVEPGAARYGGALEWLNDHRPEWLLSLVADERAGRRVEQVSVPVAGVPRSFVAQVTGVVDITAKTEGVVIVLNDLTELREADRERREIKAVFDAVARSAGDGILMVDDAEHVEFWNRAAETMFGCPREEALGRHPWELMGCAQPERRAPDQPWARSSPPGQPMLLKAHRRDGAELEIELTISEVPTDKGRQTLGVVRDVTERKRIEAHAHASARLEAVGRLAGGIAHEINTPVQFIGDSLSFLREATSVLCSLAVDLQSKADELGPSDPWAARMSERLRALDLDLPFILEETPKAVERSIDGVMRVADLVRAMKEFGHPGTGEMAAADLNRAVRNTLMVSRPSWKHVATASFEEGPLPPVMCHVEQVSQVVLNLVVNAADAIRERGPSKPTGRITVRTRIDGPDAVIEVEDDGVGISPAHQQQLFQPFFTTKELGRGTGQGLALSRHIVVDTHRGALTFRSTPGQGSTFTARIPMIRPATGA